MKMKSNLIGRITGLLLAVWLAGPALADNPAASPEGKTQSQDISYRLIPGDTLSITVPNEPNLTGENYVISAEGTVKLWLLGDVDVKDLNTQEVEAKLNKQLEKDYIKEPFVRVSVYKYRRRSVSVNGEVQKPGSFDFLGDKLLRLPEAIVLAGGWTKNSKKTDITLTRKGKTTTFNYETWKRNPDRETAPVLEDGDVIEVAQKVF